MTSAGNLLQVAVQAADRGADLVRSHLPEQLTAKGDRDYASNVDYEIERDLQAFLAEATPDIGFLGEEGGMMRAGRRHWALDPIDGTVNFANGLPLCAVSLALIEDDQPVLGVVQLPFLDKTYTAAHGQGAFLGQRRLAVATPARRRTHHALHGHYRRRSKHCRRTASSGSDIRIRVRSLTQCVVEPVEYLRNGELPAH